VCGGGRFGTGGRGEVVGKGVGGWIWCKQCIHIYVNAKMISVETVPGSGEEGWKSSERGEFKNDVFDTL
jgi:hypothetical protein